MPEDPHSIVRIHKTSVELLTERGWHTIGVANETDLQQLIKGIGEHLSLAEAYYVVAVKVRERDGQREAWFEYVISESDLDASIAWPLWIAGETHT